MDTLEINYLLKHIKNFHGAFPSDVIPKIKSYPASIIINTDKSTQPGQHWVALYIDKNQNGTYFDSYGLPPILPDIQKTINKLCKQYIYNKCTFQSYDATTCGHYCILFIELMTIDMTMNEICNIFNKKKTFNDTMVKFLIDNFQK